MPTEALTKIELKSQLRTPMINVDVEPQGPPGTAGVTGQKGDKGDTGPAGGLSNFLQATINLTPTQIKTMIASPIQLIAAPGANKMIVPIGVWLIVHSTGNTPYTVASAQDMRIKWGTTGFATGPLLDKGVLNQASDQILVSGNVTYSQDGRYTAISDLVNKALTLTQDGGATEYSVGDAPCQIQILYWIMPTA